MSRDIRSSAPPGGLTPLNPSFPSGPIPQRICLRRQRNLSYNPSNLRPGEPTVGDVLEEVLDKYLFDQLSRAVTSHPEGSGRPVEVLVVHSW